MCHFMYVDVLFAWASVSRCVYLLTVAMHVQGWMAATSWVLSSGTVGYVVHTMCRSLSHMQLWHYQ
jgi:hypothetical protein